MKPIAEYWKNVARDWHASSYDRQATEASLIEWLATFSRAHIRRRHRTAIRMLAPHVQGRRIVELGCGTGALSIDLVKAGARAALGVDISGDVVRAAEEHAREAGVADRATFVEGLVEDIAPEWSPDFVVGLGILEYLEPSTAEAVLTRMKAPREFFAFDERRVTVLTLLHAVYRRIRRLPFYQKYSAQEISDLMTRAGLGGSRVVREGGNSFVTNLPLA
jgi:SAM-dependent methyltransferase